MSENYFIRSGLLVLVTLFMCTTTMLGQQRKIQGKVIDETKAPVIGATIVVKGTTQGTTTGATGTFTINASINDVLQISYVGYHLAEITVDRSKTMYDITLKQDQVMVDEVVVTAMGISREKKSLGYAIGEVKGDDIAKAKDASVLNSLSGKVAGLVIEQTAGGPSGSSRVIIRGVTNISGSNEPLYVVDGVPLDNQKMGEANSSGGFDLGDNISSIGADNIENMTVLKGPAAAALYGSRASHGAIIITTKRANKDKAFAVDFNTSTLFEVQSLDQRELQTTYGQGYGGNIDMSGWSAGIWGPKYDPNLMVVSPVENAFNDKTSVLEGAITSPYVYVPNYLSGFFQTGVTSTNTIAVSTMKNNTGIRLAYTNMVNKDIKPNAGMQRNTFDLAVNTKVGERVDVNVNANYVSEYVKNRPGLAGDKSNVAGMIMNLPPNIPVKALRSMYQDDLGNYLDFSNMGSNAMNPYWSVYRMLNETNKDVLRSSINIKYNVLKGLDVQTTAGANYTWFDFMNYTPPTTPNVEKGSMETIRRNNKTYNVEAKVTYTNSLFSKLNYTAIAGATIFKVDNSSHSVEAIDMATKDAISVNSFLEREYVESKYEKQINSAWGLLQLSWDNYLYLDGTIRYDHSSTLPSKNNKYIYPSVSGSFVFSNLFNINPSILSYGKLRASVARVGSDTDPYQLGLTYQVKETKFLDYGRGDISNEIIPNKDLKPTMTNSAELGLELKFLNNRLGIDLTAYQQTSRDQILQLNASLTSGYAYKLANVGEMRNRGIELLFTARPVQTKNWSWDLSFNYAKNQNKVVAIADDIDMYTLVDAQWAGVKVVAATGLPYGAIMGKTFARNENGDIILDPATRLPQPSDDKNIVPLGNASWDWTGGLGSNLRYKSFSFSVMFDMKFGADMFSTTARSLIFNGKTMDTTEGRDAWYRSEQERIASGKTSGEWMPSGGYVPQGVYLEDGQWVQNIKPVNPYDYFRRITTSYPEVAIYDNSYVKIREIVLTYNFPRKLIGNKIDALSLSFIARNPLIIYKNIPLIDPESTYNTSWAGGVEYGSLPTRRSYGFNIGVKF